MDKHFNKLVSEFYDVLVKNRQDKKNGFILLPSSFDGFACYEIDAERLKLFLQMESAYRRLNNNKNETI